ncbi:F-box protein FBW2-like [Salvia hispanica]|uniref:F-box protein FBW2-like n=1 Tax=Salvia hispanica TaxID=49212 RepID=UPI002009A5AB|nr:F-box protein FBW2-like [Salvia hispanica]XP_047970998.1 F-box protein FBW2-like [Salvia hispanica]
MEEGEDSRKWDELLPDALGLIFKNLSLYEVLTVVPRVCKSWGRAATGPYCWQEIDIEEWSRNRKPEVVDGMLRLLIARSCGSLRKLTVSGLSLDKTLLFIADHGQSLRSLRLPRSEIHDAVVGKAAAMMCGLTFVDLSYCISVGAEGLEALGKNCKSLSSLRRIMHPLEVIEKLSQDDEALAIASTMPKLKNLEIAYLLVDTASIVEILSNCKHLELLDVRGCWNVKLDEKFVKMFPKLKVVGPLVVDCYDMNGWDNCSDYSGSSGYLAWDFVAGDDDIDDDDEEYGDMLDDLWGDENLMDDVEMWFYDDVHAVDAGYDWPQSP